MLSIEAIEKGTTVAGVAQILTRCRDRTRAALRRIGEQPLQRSKRSERDAVCGIIDGVKLVGTITA